MRFKISKKARKIAGLFNNGAGCFFDVYAKFVSDYPRQGSFSQSGRSMKKHVVKRFTSLPCGLNKYLKIVDDLALAGELINYRRTYIILKFLICRRLLVFNQVEIRIRHGSKINKYRLQSERSW